MRSVDPTAPPSAAAEAASCNSPPHGGEPDASTAAGQAGGHVGEEGTELRQEIARTHLTRIAREFKRGFEDNKRVLSFGEYLELFAAHPLRYGRPAPLYLLDMFEHYGSETVRRPWGKLTHFKLFDCPWETPADRGREPTLVGHEELQSEIYRSLCNFAREGRANRLVLMHGPNGSAKSTVASCILRALEDYSKHDEGGLYRFHWIFPSRKTSRGSIGFASSKSVESLESFAHLDDEEIDARLVIELRDHPLFLIPAVERRPMVDELWQSANGRAAKAPDWLRSGELSHKNKLIFEALLSSYSGDYREVLRHVQIERYYISRRYRIGAITLGPEMSVDAHERQITADRSLTALPTSLQATTLFEAFGELVEASGGVLELSDVLKRPIDAFRYLQSTLETGQVSLSQQTVFTNVVMIGSANDVHLAAFREHPEYASFRGRIELVRAPYLRSYRDEERIYQDQILPTFRRHVAPYTARTAAELAILTRMRKPDPARFDKPLNEIVKSLSAVDKLVLYGEGEPPPRLDNDKKKVLRANIDRLYHETNAEDDYEGRVGVSPRTMRTLLFDAAQSPEYRCVSPFAVLKSMDELCKRVDEHPWLKQKPLEGGYHDHRYFRDHVRIRLLDRLEADMRVGSAMIEARQYEDLFRRYIFHVSSFVKKEKMRNMVTGKDEVPDEKLMRDVEQLLGVEASAKDHRDTMISRIAAWVIDNPEGDPKHSEVFPGYVERMQTAAFAHIRPAFARLLRDTITLLRHDAVGLEPGPKREATAMAGRLVALGYDEDSAADAVSALLRHRYADIVI